MKMTLTKGLAPLDYDEVPVTVRYRYRDGKAYRIMRNPDGHAVLAEVMVSELIVLLEDGAATAPKDGWYSTSGEYLGWVLPLDD